MPFRESRNTLSWLGFASFKFIDTEALLSVSNDKVNLESRVTTPNLLAFKRNWNERQKKTNHLFDCLYMQSFPSNTNEMKCQRDCKNHIKYCNSQIVSFAELDWLPPASRVFLLLLQFWCISERLHELSKIFVEHPLLIALVNQDQLWPWFYQ